ncbi:hypothetical protein [Haloferax mediterranei]|nr:hypothetical protein [Haloferax mediterranei]
MDTLASFVPVTPPGLSFSLRTFGEDDSSVFGTETGYTSQQLIAEA